MAAIDSGAGSQRGFSLLAILVVLALVTVVAGMAVPVVSAGYSTPKVDETRTEMRSLLPAIRAYWWDNRAFPPTLTALQTNPNPPSYTQVPAPGGGWTYIINYGLTTWKGPYAQPVISRFPGVNTSLDQDAWNQPYVLTTDTATTYSPTSTTNLVTIRSIGPDHIANTDDDLVQEVDITFMRRKETTDELRILNTAITQYNAQYLATAPLPANLSQILTALYNANLLPRPATGTTDPLLTDGWGDAYVPVPNASPVTSVVSSHS